MALKQFAFSVFVAGTFAGCSQPAPIVDVQLPEQSAGRWTMQALNEPSFGGPDYLFLDTAKGTVCILKASDIVGSFGGLTVGTLDGETAGKKCKKLP